MGDDPARIQPAPRWAVKGREAAEPSAPPAGVAGPIEEFRPDRRRRRWQTRALYVLLGLAVGLYLVSQLGPSIPQAPRSGADARMIAAARALKGQVQAEPIEPGIWGWIRPERITISFVGPGFDDAGLERFAEAAGRGPTQLNLIDTTASEAALTRLGGMSRTESLSIGSGTLRRGSGGTMPAIGDRGLAALSKLKGLGMLSLHAMRIDGDGLRHLKGMSGLRQLRLTFSKVPDRALIGLGEACPSLVYLELGDTGISDAGLKNLGGLDRLEFLSIDRNPAITANGLLALKDLRSLRWLELSGIGFLEADLAAFRSARPDVEIQFGNGRTLPPIARSHP